MDNNNNENYLDILKVELPRNKGKIGLRTVNCMILQIQNGSREFWSCSSKRHLMSTVSSHLHHNLLPNEEDEEAKSEKREIFPRPPN